MNIDSLIDIGKMIYRRAVIRQSQYMYEYFTSTNIIMD